MKYTNENIDIDILRAIVNKSLSLPLIILINGHGQIGKSTFLYHLANRLEQIKKYGYGWKKHKNEFDLWNWRELVTRNAGEFINVYEKYDNSIIALEESAEILDITEFFSLANSIFSMIARTQGYKRNICLLCTPYANDLLKIHKRKIDFILWVRKKDLINKTAQIVPRYVKIDYLSLKEDNIKMGYIKSWLVYYTEKELLLTNSYTDFLKGFKSQILNKARLKVFISNRIINKKTGEITITN